MSAVDPSGRENGPHVLVVDDDPDVLRAIVRAFERLGATARAALGSEQAMQILRERTFDAVVVDFHMRGPNGAWLLRRVRDEHPTTRRYLISGLGYASLAYHLEPGLVDGFIPKPPEDEDLEVVIK